MLDVRGKAQVAVAGLLDLAAEVDAEGGERAQEDARGIRDYAENLEYRYAPDFADEEETEHAAH